MPSDGKSNALAEDLNVSSDEESDTENSGSVTGDQGSDLTKGKDLVKQLALAEISTQPGSADDDSQSLI